MIDYDYLVKGVNGIGNAHRAGSMAGHLGAAVLAGYYIGEDNPDLDSHIYEGVAGELDRIIAGEEGIWFNAAKAGVTPTELFQSLPSDADSSSKRDSQEAARNIAAALVQNIGKTRQSGHNVIFASLAIRAILDHPEFATNALISGVRGLTSSFDTAHAGRGYFGKEKGWLTGNQIELTEPDSKLPPYGSIEDMVSVTVSELIATASVKRQGFGGLWHIINHAAALVDLHRLGFTDVARKGLPAHRQHIRLWRMLPDVESELGRVIQSPLDPFDSAYWQGNLKRDEARLTHRIKTIYGFGRLVPYLTSAEHSAARLAFRFLMS
ncbi:MAG: hypothetical protein R3C20_24125 [Planctomycetaceae bacterium]